MRDRGLATGDLTRTGFATQLPHGLDQQKQSVHAGMAIGEPAAIGVDRQAAAGRNTPVGYEAAPLAFRANPRSSRKRIVFIVKASYSSRTSMSPGESRAISYAARPD